MHDAAAADERPRGGPPAGAPPLPARLPSWLWLPAAALAAALLFVATPLHRPLLHFADDLQQRLLAREETFERTLVIDIDDASLRRLQPALGSWPFDRRLHAAVAGYLLQAGAEAVVFGIVFADPRDGDDVLRARIEQDPVVLAGSAVAQADPPDAAEAERRRAVAWPVADGTPALDWAGAILPDSTLLPAGRAPAVGLLSVVADRDGVLRRLPLLHRIDGQYFAALALAAHFAAPSARLPRVDFAAGRLHAGHLSLPVDVQGRVVLVYPRNVAAVPTLAFEHVAAAALGGSEPDGLRAAIKGRTVFLGSSAFFAERVMTPVGQVTGTALVALAYEALGRSRLLAPRGSAWDVALLVFALLPAALGTRRDGRPAPARHAAFGAVAVGLMIAATAVLHLWAGRQVDLVLPLVAVLAGLAFGILHLALWSARRQQRLQAERAAAQAANRAKSEFLANVSHEIRTPLNALLGMSELLAETRLDERQRRYVEVFRSAGQSLLDLINDLLDMSKIEAGQFALSADPFSLRNMLAEQLRLLDARARGKGLALTLQVQPDIPDGVNGDRKRLAQVLVNLVDNAIKFTAQGGVAVTVERLPDEPEALRFTVRDDGIGIAADKLASIFDPFVQADGSITRRYGGTGLGLAISKFLVGMMGGRTWVESAPGQGAAFRFTVRLPAADLPPPAHAAAAIAPATRPPLRLLLAEDNPHNVFLVRSFLEDSGDRIVVAGDGVQAIERFAEGPFDLVLMDLQMPGKDGFTATREIRQLERAAGRRRTPIVALTANALDSDLRRSVQCGCDGHLVKPVSKEELLRLLRRYAPPAPAAVGLSSPPPPAAAPAAEPPLHRLERSGLFNLAAALERLGGEGSLLLSLLSLARPQFDAWPQRYAEAQAGGDRAAARRLAHDLKGVAGSVGADALAEAALQLDLALRAPTDSAAECAALAAAVVAKLQALQQVLAEALPADPPPP